MTPADPAPKPTALDLWLKYHEGSCNGVREEPCSCGLAEARQDLAALRAEVEGLKAQRDALEAKLASIERNSVGILRAIHGEKVQITKLEGEF